MYVELGLKRCDQRWDEMTPVEGGRLCGACSRHISDFRTSSDVEIALAHVRSEQPVCGLYSNPQMARLGLMDAAPAQPARRLPILALGASLLGTAAHAQTPERPPASAVPRPPAEPAQERRNPRHSTPPESAPRVIHGTVLNTAGEPLRDAIVWIAGSASRVARTDSAGAYRLNVGDEQVDEVVISALGFGRQVVTPQWTADEIMINAVLMPEMGILIGFAVGPPRSRWQRFRDRVRRLF